MSCHLKFDKLIMIYKNARLCYYKTNVTRCESKRAKHIAADFTFTPRSMDLKCMHKFTCFHVHVKHRKQNCNV